MEKILNQKEQTKTVPNNQLCQDEVIHIFGDNAAAVIHEMRAPLSGIYAHLQLLEKDLIKEGYAPKEARFTLLYQEIKRMSHLCDQVLSLSTPLPGERCFVNMEEVCSDTAALLRALAIFRGISLELSVAKSIPKIWADENQLRRLLINLVNNAMQALGNYRQDGKITITVDHCQGGLKVTVWDNGPGMESGLVKHIFDPYFTTKKEGFGLGLPMCAQITEANKGMLNVISEPGEGTSFVIIFPANIEE